MFNITDVEKLLETLTHRVRNALVDIHRDQASSCRQNDVYTISLKLDIPVCFSLSCVQSPPPFYYWARPEQSQYKIGLGRAWHYETKGGLRFNELQTAYQNLISCWQHICLDTGCAELEMTPRLFCAFAFDENDEMENSWQGFPNSTLTIPAVLLQSNDEQFTINFSVKRKYISQEYERVLNEWITDSKKLLQQLFLFEEKTTTKKNLYRELSEPEDADWLSLVNQACHRIHEGELTKVVPARHLRLRGEDPFQSGAVLQQLTKQFPSCVEVACGFSDITLVAATPEQLVSKQGNQIKCDALGGTIQQSPDSENNQKLAEDLMQSSKTRREHALVVDHMAKSLADICVELNVPKKPSILALPGLLHLRTAISAQAEIEVTLFDLLKRLHPTPAVAGTPADNAKQWLDENEPFNRGWYTGGVGWLDFHGDGEFAVLLRCALLKDNQADLYAGAGIVADSNAMDELAETELKLSGLINILGNELKDQIDEPSHYAAR